MFRCGGLQGDRMKRAQDELIAELVGGGESPGA